MPIVSGLLILKQLVFTLSLLAIGWHDVKTKQIENGSLLPIFVAGLVGFAPEQALLGLFSVSLPMLTVAIVTHGAIGGGDIKLMAACGFFLGPTHTIAAALIGFSLAGVFALARLLWKKEKAPIPLAPFLAAGCIVGLL